MALLSEPQRKVIDVFVARKKEESRKREIVKWGEEQAADRLAELLV